MRALSTLLSLDHKFGGQLIESESVMAYFDSLEAFSKIEELLNSPNQDIANEATNLLSRFAQNYEFL